MCERVCTVSPSLFFFFFFKEGAARCVQCVKLCTRCFRDSSLVVNLEPERIM